MTKCHIFYKDYSSAIPVAKKLVALQPTDPEARSLCGYALVMCGHIAEAREQYQHALELVQAKQDSELVEQVYSVCVETNPNNNIDLFHSYGLPSNL